MPGRGWQRHIINGKPTPACRGVRKNARSAGSLRWWHTDQVFAATRLLRLPTRRRGPDCLDHPVAHGEYLVMQVRGGAAVARVDLDLVADLQVGATALPHGKRAVFL